MVLTLLFMLIFCAGAFPRISQQQRLSNIHTAIMQEPTQVLVTHARLGDKTKSLTLPGELLAIQDVPVYSRADGYLHKRFVDIGDRVKAGQLLALIETPEIDQNVHQAEANLSTARSNLSGAQADKANYAAQVSAANSEITKCNAAIDFSQVQMHRYSVLAADGAVSVEQRDEMVTRYKEDIAALEIAKQDKASRESQLAAACTRIDAAHHEVDSNQANLNQLLSKQRFQKVIAPSDGVVTARLADDGTLVVAGGESGATPIVTMQKTDVLRVHVEVPESDYRDIHNGDKIALSLEEFAGQTFSGVVSKIGGGLNPDSRTLPVEVLIDNRQQVLKPGAYAEVHFKHAITNPPVVIPITAEITRNDGLYAAVVKNNRIEYRKLEIFQDYGDKVAISSGLTAGDLVVTDSGLTLPAGTLVAAKQLESW
jgi:RND family efflux transporter MFP subunit